MSYDGFKLLESGPFTKLSCSLHAVSGIPVGTVVNLESFCEAIADVHVVLSPIGLVSSGEAKSDELVREDSQNVSTDQSCRPVKVFVMRATLCNCEACDLNEKSVDKEPKSEGFLRRQHALNSAQLDERHSLGSFHVQVGNLLEGFDPDVKSVVFVDPVDVDVLVSLVEEVSVEKHLRKSLALVVDGHRLMGGSVFEELRDIIPVEFEAT